MQQPIVTLLNFSSHTPISMFECNSEEMYQKTLEKLEQTIVLTPQGIFLKCSSDKVSENGVLLLPGGEKQPLYSGAHLQCAADVLYWSINISAQLCKPAEFDL